MRWIVLIYIVGMSQWLTAQQSSDKLQRMAALGFENLELITISDGYQNIAFENRRYRYAATAINHLLSDSLISSDTLDLVMKYRNLPITSIRLINGQLISILFNNSKPHYARNDSLINPSFFRLDLPLGIDYGYQLGNYDRPLLLALHATAGVELSVADGLGLQAAMAFPLFNNHDSNTYVRLHHLILTHDFRLPNQFWLSASAGLFGRNRAGFDLQWIKLLNQGNWAYGMQLGYTHYNELTGRAKFRQLENFPSFLYTFDLSWRWSRYDLVASLSAGQFLYKDKGFNFQLSRYWGERQLGLQLAWTEEGKNGGFFLRWPFLYNDHGKPSSVRPRPMRSIPLDYRYVGNDRTARNYYTGETLIRRLREYDPSILQKRIR